MRTPRNDSLEPGLDGVLAQALRREALRRGALELVEATPVADLRVAGQIEPLQVRRASISSVLLSLEYDVTLRVRLGANGREGTLLKPALFQESERYLASADVEATRKNRDEALRRLAQVVSERFYDALSAEVSR